MQLLFQLDDDGGLWERGFKFHSVSSMVQHIISAVSMFFNVLQQRVLAEEEVVSCKEAKKVWVQLNVHETRQFENPCHGRSAER